MYVILSYDVGSKRVGKALKTCRKYLRHRHRSVFEGEITEGELHKLEGELERMIDIEHDAICVYRIENIHNVTTDEIGVAQVLGHII